jgi:hypothetical protein
MIRRWIMGGGAGVEVVLAAALAAGQTGTTIVVNAGGNLQAALNRAAPGDTILLQAGATFQGNFELPVKPVGGYITIRSSAPDHLLPAATERISLQHLGAVPTIVALPNGLPALRTAPGTRRWRIVAVQFRGSPGTAEAQERPARAHRRQRPRALLAGCAERVRSALHPS